MREKIILLADDDADDTEMFCEALECNSEKTKCYCAGNGSDALKILEELDEKPKLIFLDLNMPVMNGWDCLKKLKNNPEFQDIPVIMISTSSHQKDIETASALGAICYLVKPNSFNDLKQLLASLTAALENELRPTIINLQKNGSRNIFAT
jgi:CheY-like chemotaxis protein